MCAIVIIWLIVAYRWYGSVIDRSVVRPDDNREPPSCTDFDGVDYCPGKPVVLFGHHFSSIAGAGPIIGPVAAECARRQGAGVLTTERNRDRERQSNRGRLEPGDVVLREFR